MSQPQPEGFLALPASGTGQPVLVLHAWWGLNNTFKGVCTRLADEGFVAFAPDLYHGKVTDQISEAEKLAPALSAKSDQAEQEISEALAFLKEKTGSDSVAVIGFSMGAYYALDLSVREADSIRAVVIFYGTGPADFKLGKASYQGHFAGDDPYEPTDDVRALEEDIRQSGRSVTFHTYPDTGHWFFEANRPDAYNEAASTLAWQRTIEFLKQALTPQT